MSSDLHAPAALPPGKDPQYPLDKRRGGLQDWSGRCGKENSFPCQDLNYDPSVFQAIT
jgi:hypothetical protein